MAVETSGDRQGFPVFLLHGTPGSRSGPKPRGIVLYRLGVRLVCYDRPGYGGSDRHEGRQVADAAADVRAIADALELDRFAVVGRSGGGPHALACAASNLLTNRVTRVAVLVSLAPSDASDLDWYGGMTNSNVDEYTQASNDPLSLTGTLTRRADTMRRDPESLVDLLRPGLTPADRKVVEDVAMRRLLAQSYAEAVRRGADGWIDDALALRKDWGFDLSSIKVPVRLWHGAEDTFSPVAHARWLASRIPSAEVQVQQGAGHFGAMEILPQILAWLTAPQDALVAAPGTAPA
ncbi:alpha/beta hydrolase [Micromonospora sp. NPDC049559]|uniref:alpha/beta fold hydrolase n=1 Tax=Micromonospora sp. NPDC049559 TaxID=3155923 RepID=UPI00343F42AD